MVKISKSMLFLLCIFIFSCSEVEDMVIEEQKFSKFEKIALEEISRSQNLDKENLELITLTIREFEVPVVISKLNGDMYPVLINDEGHVQAVLKQEITSDDNGLISFKHYANGNYIGDYKKSQDNVLIEFLGQPADEPLLVTFSDCEQQEGESCAGCHYRQMKDIIAQDGDAQATCDFLNSLGGLCDAEVYVAATLHCWLQHNEPEIEEN